MITSTLMNDRRRLRPLQVPVTQTPKSASTPREEALFRLLEVDDDGYVTKSRLREELDAAGLRRDDPRLAGVMEALRSHPKEEMDPATFRGVIQSSVLLVERALTHNMTIPDFPGFTSDLRDLLEQSAANEGGEVASYIPQLARIDPSYFGLGLCSVDGQRVAMGDAERSFSLQSSAKPITYALALEEHGEEGVHRHVGREPSGRSFNELALNDRGLPHNPLVNAGAIMSASLVRPQEPVAQRFEHVLDVWTRLTGGVRPVFNNATYLSERATADRNFALGYSMREQGAFPAGTDLVETLEFYFQLGSLELSASAFSVVAATLANGGINPLTGEVILKPSTVQRCLSLMYSCGMYDFSGEWAFRVGLPAKSGVSGVVLIVIPNVLGLAVWSPRVDHHGNSVRGVDFAQRLVRDFNFHNYDSLVGGAHGKKDPRRHPNRERRSQVVDLCWAASEGDLDGLRRLVAEGADPGDADYDGRTPLHLAAAEGRTEVVRYLLAAGVDPRPLDRWGKTPLSDATRGDHEEIVEILETGS